MRYRGYFTEKIPNLFSLGMYIIYLGRKKIKQIFTTQYKCYLPSIEGVKLGSLGMGGIKTDFPGKRVA